MPLELQELDKQKVSFFNFKKIGNQYLLTNDIGDYCFLEQGSFDAYLCGTIEQVYPERYLELQGKGFIRDKIDFDRLTDKCASKNALLGRGPSLHIMVVTLRCDHKCLYCQAGSAGLEAKGLDMSIPDARAVVNRIFESPNPDITIEFQGGEPLINFEVIKAAFEYAQSKNKKRKKNLIFTVVSNLSFINPRIISFLIENNIHICISLDGPEQVHNKYRIALGRNSYKNTVKWFKIIRREFRKAGVASIPSALATLTRFSLEYPKEIVDEYINLGLEGVHLRPVNPFAIPGAIWAKISYSAEDFIKFYIKALDYILEINLKGKYFPERFAAIFLTKILTDRDPQYLDIHSPCGAGIGQLAYNFDGNVYTCDEGRMLSRRGDETFKVGNVNINSYQEIIGHPAIKAMCLASCLDNLAGCSQCVYKPYCGVCPLYNYSATGDIFNKAPFLCSVNKGIMDYLFTRLQEPRINNIFLKWVTANKGGVQSEKV